MRFRSFAALLIVSVAAGCGGGDDPPTPVTGGDGLGATGGRTGDVGQGYASPSFAIKPMYCIQPQAGQKWPEVGRPVANLSMGLITDRRQLAQSLGIDVEASYSIVSAAATFYRETQADAFAASYVFGGSIDLKDVQVGANYEINPRLVGTNPVDWQQYCGDQYVQSISRGASLFSMLKFQFASASDKQTFESKFKVGAAFSVSTALKFAQQVSGTNVSVSITAVQVGGDATQLSGVLGDAKASSCGMGSIEGCLEYADKIQKYASDTFPRQFLDSSGKPLEGAALEAVVATTGYTTQPWSSLPIPNLANLRENAQAQRLLQLYGDQFSDQARLDAIDALQVLSNRSADMAAKQRKATADARDILGSNFAALGQAWRECYPSSGNNCRNAVNTAAAALQAPPRDSLQPWFELALPNGWVGMPHPLKLVDVRGDGHRDYCVPVYESPVFRCVMGVGEGFEDSARVSLAVPSTNVTVKNGSVAYEPILPARYSGVVWTKLDGFGERRFVCIAPITLPLPYSYNSMCAEFANKSISANGLWMSVRREDNALTYFWSNFVNQSQINPLAIDAQLRAAKDTMFQQSSMGDQSIFFTY